MPRNSTDAPFRSAFVALVGRPNCGKSTLLNTVLGEHLSIVTPLPQTTRKNLRGIYNAPNLQLVFIDTPGIHRGRHALNKSMYAQGTRVLADGSVDIVCYLVDLSRALGDEEDAVAGLVAQVPAPVCIVFNKADLCRCVDRCCAEFSARYPALASHRRCILSAIEASAKTTFLDTIAPLVGEGPRYYPGDDLSDADMRFIAAEFIRKRLIETTREEVPHAACVEILSYRELPDRHEIKAAIHVETDGQKGIVIGKGGSRIRQIREQAGRDISSMAGAAVVLECHVRVTPKWRDNRAFLKELGLSAPD